MVEISAFTAISFISLCFIVYFFGGVDFLIAKCRNENSRIGLVYKDFFEKTQGDDFSLQSSIDDVNIDFKKRKFVQTDFSIKQKPRTNSVLYKASDSDDFNEEPQNVDEESLFDFKLNVLTSKKPAQSSHFNIFFPFANIIKIFQRSPLKTFPTDFYEIPHNIEHHMPTRPPKQISKMTLTSSDVNISTLPQSDQKSSYENPFYLFDDAKEEKESFYNIEEKEETHNDRGSKRARPMLNYPMINRISTSNNLKILDGKKLPTSLSQKKRQVKNLTRYNGPGLNIDAADIAAINTVQLQHRNETNESEENYSYLISNLLVVDSATPLPDIDFLAGVDESRKIVNATNKDLYNKNSRKKSSRRNINGPGIICKEEPKDI
jgi:hypothetical protein